MHLSARVLRRGLCGGFVEDRQVVAKLVQVVSSTVQVRGTPLDCGMRDGLGARRGYDRIDGSLEQILVHTAMLVEQAEASLDAVHEGVTLLVREAFVVDAG